MAIKQKFSNYTGVGISKRSLEEATAEVQRECDTRRRLYDRWVDEGKISWVDAHDRMERLLTALHFLTGHRSIGPLGGEDFPGESGEAM